MNLQEFNELVNEKNADLLSRLVRNGGLRGLLDTHCEEYKAVSRVSRLDMLQELLRIVPGIETLEVPFINMLYRHGYEESYAVDEFKLGVCAALTDVLLMDGILGKWSGRRG